MKTTSIAVAVLFAFASVALSCVDLRDHWTVEPTTPPPGLEMSTPEESETINQAKRGVEDFAHAANTYVNRRNVDIAKEEQSVAFIEGFTSAGLDAIGDTVGTWAGPFAPLAMLVIGYATKRRKDRTPDEVAKEKEDSYAKGRQDAIDAARVSGDELAKAIAVAIKDAS